ncbi:TRAP transporter large permease [Desulfotignum phosphitoxidans]|jgi:tripartite ATP-independent transporter DctM subunit|uniref:Sialic acid TRAP transporter fused permease protein SiaQM n=1 Tax=Desulfotignum phosphitoxidans DSM 13687 TaxID=1286635 RepID=S0G6G7_9BACT|nr:TRAP transporter large permease subunit [Desulfotignum phosphitoxidans]EMS81634.1 sialic acid TRAP transporter fused permease protein SiaQM [Desulfotignum phosphitoxidans DSM 13687]
MCNNGIASGDLSIAEIEEQKLSRPEELEDYLSLALFWTLGAVVFLQFFTRYVLNNSMGWTEEIARMLLVACSLLGSSLAIRKNSHISVEFFYRYLSPRGGVIFSRVVDLLRIVFFIVLLFTCYKLAGRTFGALVSVDVPKKVLYYIFNGMIGVNLIRSVHVAVLNWKNGGSSLNLTAPPVTNPDYKASFTDWIAPGIIVILGALTIWALLAGNELYFMFALAFTVIIIGLPVAFCLAGSAYIYILVSGMAPDVVIAHRLINGMDSFPLLAIPFFILAGTLMNSVGITDRLFDFAKSLVGWLPGGLGHVNVGASIIFAGMSGAAVADAGGLGTIEIKAMKDAGYDPEFSVGITAASSTIGPIIPPSLPMVAFGVMASCSVGQLFAAGFIPGLLMGTALMAMVAYMAHKRKYPREDRFRAGFLVSSFKRSFLSLMTPTIIVGGILTGIFTPTEAAIGAVVYGILLGFFYRTLTFKKFVSISMETIDTSATIMMIIGAAAVFAWILTSNQVANLFAAFVMDNFTSKFMILLTINLILLVVGCFLEPIAAITIMVPVLMPLSQMIGLDVIHLGVLMVLNLMIGLLTPPVGTVLYVLSRVSGIKFERCLVGTAPFFIPLIAVLILITYVEGFSLFLPNLIYR